MTQDNHSSWYDSLRAIATIGVIGIHVSSSYVPMRGSSITEAEFWFGNIFDSLSRFAVPLFVMLSGALLLGKEEPTKIFIKKRISRLLWPFLFWSLAYIANSLVNDYNDGIPHSFIETAGIILSQLRDGASIHLWYVYMIIGLYLFVPIIRKWITHASEKDLLYFLGIWFVVMLISQPGINVINPKLDMRYFGGFLGYLVLGYYLRIKDFRKPKTETLLGIAMTITGFLATIFGTYWLHWQSGKYPSTFYEPLSPNILLYAAGLFLLFKNKDLHSRPVTLVRDIISKYSYGIFLVHILFISKLDDWSVNWKLIHPLAGIPITILSCLILSTATIAFVRVIPGGKHISG